MRSKLGAPQLFSEAVVKLSQSKETSMRKFMLLAATIFLGTSAMAQVQTIPVPAKNFAIGTPISRGGDGWEASVAIDGAGNSVAVWDERTIHAFITNKIWTKSHPLGGPWSAKTVLSGSLQTTYVFPKVLTSVDGKAAAVWSDTGGVWTANRSPAGAWSKAQLRLPGVSSPIFVMNAQGDAAILWGSGGDRGGPTQLNAIRRTAGGAWGSPQILASGVHVAVYNATLSDNGDLLAAWETYTAVCARHCTLSNFVLHVSREARGSTNWQDSGPLTAAASTSHNASVAADPADHAGAVYFNGFGTLLAITQAQAGAPWTSPVTVYSTSMIMKAGLAADSSGNATLALLEIGTAATSVKTINGSLLTNTWNAPVTVSGTDKSTSQIVFAEGSSGAAVLAWSADNPGFTNNKIRAAYRPSTAGAWTAPQTISSPGAQLASPEAAAINAAGNAAVIFSAFDASFSVHTEYASTR
jgi:hypothetical protein